MVKTEKGIVRSPVRLPQRENACLPITESSLPNDNIVIEVWWKEESPIEVIELGIERRPDNEEHPENVNLFIDVIAVLKVNDVIAVCEKALLPM